MLTTLHASRILLPQLRAAGLEVRGLAFGDPADVATWRVDLHDPTPEQLATAAAIVAAFDPSDASLEADLALAAFQSPEWTAVIDVMVAQLRALGASTTAAQFRAQVRTRYAELRTPTAPAGTSR